MQWGNNRDGLHCYARAYVTLIIIITSIGYYLLYIYTNHVDMYVSYNKVYCNEKLYDEPDIDHNQSIIPRWGMY